MSLETLLSRTATITSRTQSGPRDSHGNRAWVETTITSPCYLEQTAEQELTVDRETQIADHLLVLPANAIIDGNDDVEIEGQHFIVVGPPKVFYRFDVVHHVEANLRSLSG